MATRWFILLSLILAGLDQYTKFLARKLVEPEILEKLISGDTSTIIQKNEILPEFYRLTLNFNKGIAWGMLPQWSEYFTYFAIVMVLVILMILKKLDRDEVWLKIALVFQMAGAIGNMTDRLIFHRVTDFLDVTLFPNTNVHYQWQLFTKTYNFRLPYDWPIFNLADSFVVVGTIVLVMVLIFTREQPVDKAAETGKISGVLTGYQDGEEWEDVERLPGSVPTEEALVEIPPDPESEMLIPFEDSVESEEIEEPLGKQTDNHDEAPEDPSSPIKP